jgi:DNA-binding MarR family transcriptional regulator
LQKVQQFFVKAEFFEKAIEILNKQRDIAENMLYDYSMVSMLVK